MLKFIPLGGISEVTGNMFLYETDRDILIVDCGIGFPEEEKENNLLIPDFSYLRSTTKNIRGVIVSHAHFDHYGALPYLLSEFNLPVFSSRLTLAFVQERLKELKINKGANLRLLKPQQKLHLGDFNITPFLVNHSVPDAFAFCLEALGVKFFHVSDYKFDLTPVDGKVFDFQSCLRLASGGVSALFSDCLGACEEGFTQTEESVEDTLYRLIAKAKSQVFVTTLSSNISRIQQIINASMRLNKEVVVLGRSMETSIKNAQRLKYLKSGKGLKKGKSLDENRVVYLVAGSYGQTGSALTRIVQGKHPQVVLKKGAVVIFSADPSPPNTKDKVDKLVDLLTLKGARVHYYEIQESLHVSGHGSSNDVRLLFALVKPQFVIPIGGCPRHMRAYSFLAQEMGIVRNRVFELLPGESLLLTKTSLHRGPKVSLKQQTVLV